MRVLQKAWVVTSPYEPRTPGKGLQKLWEVVRRLFRWFIFLSMLAAWLGIVYYDAGLFKLIKSMRHAEIRNLLSEIGQVFQHHARG